MAKTPGQIVNEMLWNSATGEDIAAAVIAHVRQHIEAASSAAAIINDDGSLTLLSDHRDILVDAMSALNGAPALVAELEAANKRADEAEKDAAMFKDAYYGSAPSGATLRCRKCGDVTEISFHVAKEMRNG